MLFARALIAAFLLLAGLTAPHVLAAGEPANRQFTEDAVPPGSLMLGPDSRDCDAAIEGALRYSSATKSIEFCNGNAWTRWGRK